MRERNVPPSSQVPPLEVAPYANWENWTNEVVDLRESRAWILEPPVADIHFQAQVIDHGGRVEWQESYSVLDFEIAPQVATKLLRGFRRLPAPTLSVASRAFSKAKVPVVRREGFFAREAGESFWGTIIPCERINHGCSGFTVRLFRGSCEGRYGKKS